MIIKFLWTNLLAIYDIFLRNQSYGIMITYLAMVYGVWQHIWLWYFQEGSRIGFRCLRTTVDLFTKCVAMFTF